MSEFLKAALEASVMTDSLKRRFLDPLVEQRERWADEEKVRVELRKVVTAESLQAIALLADAGRHPDIARSDLKEAALHFEKAMDAAEELDPEPEEDHEPTNAAGLTRDQVLDDNRRGQAESINRENRGRG
jgi:ABC-type transporter Mla MlaB component